MLDDLLLLTDGQVVYAGTIKDANPYFASHGFANVEKINPSDYYLDLVQGEGPNGKAWADLFVESKQGKMFADELVELRDSAAERIAPPKVDTFARLVIMIVHFMDYFLEDPGYVFHRLAALIVIAFFEGTLFLRLTPTTDNIPLYVGGLFSTAVAVMLAAVAATAAAKRAKTSIASSPAGDITEGREDFGKMQAYD